MNDIILNEKKQINARDFFIKLFENEKTKTPFSMWFQRRVREYKLIDGVDFFTNLLKSTGGRPKIEYTISIECAKVLCLVEKTKTSEAYRKYLIRVEEAVKKQELVRLAGIEARKTLTDTIKDSGINDKMHGHAYSTITKLVYKSLDIEYVKMKGFRDTLNEQQLKQVESMEKIIDGCIQMGLEYSEIKEALPDFTKKLVESTC